MKVKKCYQKPVLELTELLLEQGLATSSMENTGISRYEYDSTGEHEVLEHYD